MPETWPLMYYLIYISSAEKPLTYDELSTLLRKSRERNQALGITGMLLYKDGSFMQMLEGEKQDVLDLYDTIRHDDRHRGVHTVLSGDIEERNFQDWSMGFFNMDKAGEYPKYSDYINEHLRLHSFNDRSKEAYDFMVSFNELNE